MTLSINLLTIHIYTLKRGQSLKNVPVICRVARTPHSAGYHFLQIAQIAQIEIHLTRNNFQVMPTTKQKLTLYTAYLAITNLFQVHKQIAS